MIIIVMIMIIIMIFFIIIVIITQPLAGHFADRVSQSMIYMGGNVPLTITITDAFSPYSNHSALAGLCAFLHIITCGRCSSKFDLKRR